MDENRLGDSESAGELEKLASEVDQFGDQLIFEFRRASASLSQ